MSVSSSCLNNKSYFSRFIVECSLTTNHEHIFENINIPYTHLVMTIITLAEIISTYYTLNYLLFFI